jgi:hypothetical protein
MLALLMAEVVLGLVFPHLKGSHQHPGTVWRDDFLNEGRLGKYHSLLGWVLKPDSVSTNRAWEFMHLIRTNSKGMRDDEVSMETKLGMRRILLLGDSFAMGDGVEEDFMFANLLEQRMRDTEVVNMAVSGYGTDQELLSFREYGKQYGADIVMLAFTIANDFRNNMSHTQYGLKKPRFILDSDVLRLTGAPVPLQKSADEKTPAEGSRTHAFHDFLDRGSALYSLIFERLSGISWIRTRWEASGLVYPREDIFYSDQVGILCSDPDVQQAMAWRTTLAIISAWQQEVLNTGAVPVLVLIPSHLQVYDGVLDRVLTKHQLDPESYDRDYPNRRLVEYCRKVNLHVIDLLPALTEAAANGNDVYYRRNPHWNRKGHMLAAQIIASDLSKPAGPDG